MLKVACGVLGLTQLGSWSLFTRKRRFPDWTNMARSLLVTHRSHLFGLRDEAGRDFTEVCADKEGSLT